MMNVANFIADPNYVQQAFAKSEPYFAQEAGVGTNPYRVMFVTRDYLQQHADVVSKIARASLRGWREYLK